MGVRCAPGLPGLRFEQAFCSCAVREIGVKYSLDAGELCNEWVAFSKQHNECAMDAESTEIWENQVTEKSHLGTMIVVWEPD